MHHPIRVFILSHATWFILIIALSGILLFQAIPGPHTLDDAYITYRYARNISMGQGFVYNPGERVQGTTTPLYTLVLALLSLPLGPEKLPAISFVIALIADTINTLLLFRIARMLLKNGIAATVLTIVFLLQPLRINVAQGGMETSLFITFLLAMYDRYFIGKSVYSAAIFGALAILTRVDAVLVIMPVFLHALWKERKTTTKAALMAVALIAPWFLWAAWYFGNPIPQSILAKSVLYQYTLPENMFFLLTFLGTGTIGPYQQILIILPGLVIALFLILIGIRWMIEGNQDAFIVIAYPIFYYIVMATQHAPLFFCWYYLPLMPGFLLLFFGAFVHLVNNSALVSNYKHQVVLFSLFGFILICFPALLMQVQPGWADSREVESLFRQSSTSIENEIQTGQIVLAPDIGVIGWELQRAKILDPIGLVSPISLNYKREAQDLVSIKMIKDLKPDYLIARALFIYDLASHPRFLADYQLIQQIGTPNTNSGQVLIYKRH